MQPPEMQLSSQRGGSHEGLQLEREWLCSLAASEPTSGDSLTASAVLKGLAETGWHTQGKRL